MDHIANSPFQKEKSLYKAIGTELAIIVICNKYWQKCLRFTSVFIFFLTVSHAISAQQLPLFSQYSFNAFLLNPAVAGAEGYTAINLTNREQWLGVEGAPQTGVVSVQTRIMKRKYIETDASVRRRYLRPLHSGRVGLGACIYYDRAGLIDQTGAQFTYAYHIAKTKSQFSIGLTFCMLQFRVNTNELVSVNPQNDLLTNRKLLVYIPDFNIGAYYTDQNKFLGLSILQLAEGFANFGNYNRKDFIIYRHFYLTGGYKIELNEQTILEPSFYFKTSEEWRMQMDATLKLIYDNRCWIGMACRTGTTFIASVGLRIDRLHLGYAFDYSPSGLLNNSYGSHELMVALKLGDNVRRYRWMERY
jgi:type IX secretion system PorP/SprF family membrane protein